MTDQQQVEDQKLADAYEVLVNQNEWEVFIVPPLNPRPGTLAEILEELETKLHPRVFAIKDDPNMPTIPQPGAELKGIKDLHRLRDLAELLEKRCKLRGALGQFYQAQKNAYDIYRGI